MGTQKTKFKIFTVLGMGLWVVLGKTNLTYSAFMSKQQEETVRVSQERVLVDQQARINHAKELLGEGYGRSPAARLEAYADLQQVLIQKAAQDLPLRYRMLSHQISKTVIEESNRYGLDPLFLVAIIESESNFNPDRKGDAGEIGLMQILPMTGHWISKMFEIKWKGAATLKDPIQNIKIGAAYVSYLRSKFDSHGQLYLAAYNMGPTNVRKALANLILPKDYAERVLKNYIKLYNELALTVPKGPALAMQ